MQSSKTEKKQQWGGKDFKSYEVEPAETQDTRLIFPAGFPGGSVVKNLPANAGDTGDTGSIPGSGRSPGEGNGNPLQYSYLENPMDRGAWQATKSQT